MNEFTLKPLKAFYTYGELRKFFRKNKFKDNARISISVQPFLKSNPYSLHIHQDGYGKIIFINNSFPINSPDEDNNLCIMESESEI